MATRKKAKKEEEVIEEVVIEETEETSEQKATEEVEEESVEEELDESDRMTDEEKDALFQKKMNELLKVAKKNKNILSDEAIIDALKDSHALLTADYFAKALGFFEGKKVEVISITEDDELDDEDIEFDISEEEEIDLEKIELSVRQP